MVTWLVVMIWQHLLIETESVHIVIYPSQDVLEEVVREVEDEAQQRLQQHNTKSQAGKKGTPARRPGSSGQQLPATPRTPAVASAGAADSQQLVRFMVESWGPERMGCSAGAPAAAGSASLPGQARRAPSLPPSARKDPQQKGGQETDRRSLQNTPPAPSMHNCSKSLTSVSRHGGLTC